MCKHTLPPISSLQSTDIVNTGHSQLEQQTDPCDIGLTNPEQSVLLQFSNLLTRPHSTFQSAHALTLHPLAQGNNPEALWPRNCTEQHVKPISKFNTTNVQYVERSTKREQRTKEVIWRWYQERM
jgi:hypothetical protein